MFFYSAYFIKKTSYKIIMFYYYILLFDTFATKREFYFIFEPSN